MWQFFALVAISLVGAYVLRPRPQSAAPPPVQQVDAPTAEDGREIPVLFGCRNIKGPNVVWYGTVVTEPIRVKGGGGKK